MSEKIYTIPISEAFGECADDKTLGCPFCRLYNRLEANEIDIILGASMMEPDIRMKTNEMGFCDVHFARLLGGKSKLGLGLILESHLADVRREITDGKTASLFGRKGQSAARKLNSLSRSCYICSKLEKTFEKMISNAVQFYSEDEKFRSTVQSVPYLCLPHLSMWLDSAKAELKKSYSDFYTEVSAPTLSYFDSLSEDVSWFCKKFDYRYDEQPWGNSKDAVERAGKFLCGDLHQPVRPAIIQSTEDKI